MKNADLDVLGGTFRAITDAQKEQLNIGYGLEVMKISGGKLKDAGVPKGFIIQKVNDESIKSVENLQDAVKGRSSAERIREKTRKMATKVKFRGFFLAVSRKSYNFAKWLETKLYMRQLKITKSITNRESASLEKYLQEIGKEEMISAEEEVELAQRIKKGDQKALERLTKANLRFVVSVAKQYQNQGLTLPDLINEGNLGLLKAAERFDETRGFKFISYAVWWIRQSILQAISEQSRIVRLPLNQVGSLNKINREINKFEQENERRPSLNEIADKIDLPQEKIDEAMSVNSHHISVDAPFADSEDSSLLDVLVNEDIPTTDMGLVNESLKSEIQAALSVLSERERKVIEASYGIEQPELTLEEIGEKFGLSRERVRQIKEKAIRKLRTSTKNKTLKTYLG